MMMVPEDVHQGTGEKKQIGRNGERVTSMCRQQVNAERRRENGYSQSRLGAEKTSECVHGDSNRRRSCRYGQFIVPSGD
jgi:hypothetical protein